jgi:hypothetical protein
MGIVGVPEFISRHMEFLCKSGAGDGVRTRDLRISREHENAIPYESDAPPG